MIFILFFLYVDIDLMGKLFQTRKRRNLMEASGNTSKLELSDFFDIT